VNKVALLLWGDPQRPLAQFGAELRETLLPDLLDAGAARLKLSITEDQVPRVSVLPLRRVPFALLSMWSESDVLAASRNGIAKLNLRWAAYRVSEALPVSYHRTWPDAERSPGAVLLTLFRKKPALTQERFIDIWHGEHTPLSLQVHPLWSYTRNVVEAALSHAAPDFDGIVEEHFRELKDILRPWRMFGGKARMLPNMLKIGLHVHTFLHLPSIENYLLREYHIRSDFRG
jgi:hypothetical protein